MTIRDEVLSANRKYAESFGDKSKLALPPARRAASITLTTLWCAAVASAETITTRSFAPSDTAFSSAASSSTLRPSTGLRLTT